jgi:hypothetical protein
MKVLMRVMILFAAVLLAGNMAFANGCDREVCYEVEASSEGVLGYNDFWFVCLNDNGTGYLYSERSYEEYDLYLFSQPAFYSTEKPGWGWGSWILVGEENGLRIDHVWTQALGLYLQGASVESGTRWTMNGKQVPCFNGNGNDIPPPPQ